MDKNPLDKALNFIKAEGIVGLIEEGDMVQKYNLTSKDMKGGLEVFNLAAI